MRQNNMRCLLRTMLPPNSLDEVPFGIHQIKINTMIDQVILALLDILGRGEVHAVFLADVLDLVPGAGEAYDRRVELGQVFGEHAGRVARWVAGDEDGEERWEGGGLGIGGGEERRGVDEVDHGGHFVEFLGADIWTV